MSVDTTHPLYVEMQSRWKQCRDCYEGQYAVHKEGELYLPRLGGQDDTQYLSYKNRTRFFNAFRRTVSAMVGLAFRKPVTVDGDEAILENVNGRGDDISDYCQTVVTDILTTGSFGTLIDYPTLPKGLSVAQVEALNARPIFVSYVTENIINWEYTTENNIRVLKRVVLREYYSPEDADEFSSEEDVRYRVLDIEDGFYRQRIFNDSDEQVGEDAFPEMNGEKLPFIPFIHFGSLLPPLMDLSDNNIKHYQLKADHTHGLHYVALPTPYVTGVSEDDAPTCIGASKIWRFESPEAKVGYLEFTGEGLGKIQEEIAAIEKNMSELGARLLDQEAVQPATATAAAIDNQNQNASLVNIINATQTDMNRAIKIMTEWAKKAETAIEIQTDFLPQHMAPEELTSVTDAWMKGAISKETLFYNLQNGEMVPEERTYEDEEQLIADNPPPVADMFSAPVEESEEE